MLPLICEDNTRAGTTNRDMPVVKKQIHADRTSFVAPWRRRIYATNKQLSCAVRALVGATILPIAVDRQPWRAGIRIAACCKPPDRAEVNVLNTPTPSPFFPPRKGMALHHQPRLPARSPRSKRKQARKNSATHATAIAHQYFLQDSCKCCRGEAIRRGIAPSHQRALRKTRVGNFQRLSFYF